MTSTPESITRDELEAYYKRMTHADGDLTEGAADRVFANILAHREPEYEPGSYYASPAGAAWRRTDDGMWEEAGVCGKYSHDFPVRPLRKLVPEGSPEHAAPLVAEWRGLGEQGDAVPAWRAAYRAALRKCADELEYALKQEDSDD